jgi:RNA polymerase sigma factor (sigma-70 family)
LQLNTESNNQNTLNPAKWVDLYADYLYKFAYYRVNKDELAEDLVQDTFLSALKAKDNYKGEASEKTWLVAILKNKIIDHYKKASTKNESPLKLASEDAPSYDYFSIVVILDHGKKIHSQKTGLVLKTLTILRNFTKPSKNAFRAYGEMARHIYHEFIG